MKAPNKSLHFLFMVNVIDFLLSTMFHDCWDELDIWATYSNDYVFSDTIIDEKYVLAHYIKQDNASWYDKVYTRKLSFGKWLKANFGKLPPAQITHMCEEYKSLLIGENANFQIIEGDDIKKAYYHKSTVPNHGTLSKSCMRYKRCQNDNYFQVYANSAKMLILTPKRGHRIMGRAILWPYGDSYLMDRVYIAENYMEYQFREYAKRMGWGILARNQYVTDNYEQRWLMPDDNYETPQKITITIPWPEGCEKVPFMDSVCYVSRDGQWISTKPDVGMTQICHGTTGHTYANYNFIDDEG